MEPKLPWFFLPDLVIMPRDRRLSFCPEASCAWGLLSSWKCSRCYNQMIDEVPLALKKVDDEIIHKSFSDRKGLTQHMAGDSELIDQRPDMNTERWPVSSSPLSEHVLSTCLTGSRTVQSHWYSWKTPWQQSSIILYFSDLKKRISLINLPQGLASPTRARRWWLKYIVLNRSSPRQGRKACAKQEDTPKLKSSPKRLGGLKKVKS